MKENEGKTLVNKIIDKVMADTICKLAASQPDRASHDPARLPGEPILYEKDGWGIFTASEYGNQFAIAGKEGGCLTHIGCDCFFFTGSFSYWSFSRTISQEEETSFRFVCSECDEILPHSAYLELVRVYKFINNL